MVDIEEYISSLFRLENSAAAKPSSNNFKGINQRIPNKTEFKLRQVFHTDIRKLLRMITLHQLPVFIP